MQFVLSLLVLVFTLQAKAQEDLFDVGMDKEQSKLIVQYLKEGRDEVLKLPTAQAIFEFYQAKFKQRSQELERLCPTDEAVVDERCEQEKAALQQTAEKTLGDMKERIDKNPRLAKMIFQAQAKKVVQNGQELLNVMFFLSRYSAGQAIEARFALKNYLSVTEYRWVFNNDWQPWMISLLVLTVPVDIVTLPFTFIASAITGF